MFTWLWIFQIVLFGAVVGPGCVLTMDLQNVTTCEEFERGARFDIYEAVEYLWKIFYFWANTTEIYPIMFALPESKRLGKFKAVVDSVHEHLAVEWKRAALFMFPRPDTEILLLYAGTPGAFRALVKQQRRFKDSPQPEPRLKFADVRMKIVDGFMGMMCCEDLTAYALATTENMPETEWKCEKAASKIGYRGHEGRSYFYIMRKRSSEL